MKIPSIENLYNLGNRRHENWKSFTMVTVSEYGTALGQPQLTNLKATCWLRLSNFM